MFNRAYQLASWSQLTAISIAACNRSPTNDHKIDGWEISIVPQDTVDGEMIYVGKNGDLIVTISDIDGRRIFLNEKEVGDTVDIRDADRDGKFDYLSYRGREHQIFDNDFDGEIDVIGNVADGSVRLLYKGQWHDLQRADGQMYIDVDDERIEVTYSDGQGLVPTSVE